MAIQHTLDALLNELTQDEAAELATLIKTWPNHDSELQRLVEENFYELLEAVRSSSSNSQQPEEREKADHYHPSSSLTGSLFPTPGSC
ncbi:MAG: hypothetical protein F6K16_30075 [Symploca sp. SIO2B6]|nr:hypothetical protein [Symploca sp. SIO2B6]